MKEIRALVRRLTAKYETASPFEMCDLLHIDVYRSDLPTCVRGLCFQTESGHSIILLNREMEERERRYCCAHELGHALLHPGLNAQTMADLTDLCVPKLEREADCFAACLLIDPFVDEWRESYEMLTLDQIADLAGLPQKAVELWHEVAAK